MMLTRKKKKLRRNGYKKGIRVKLEKLWCSLKKKALDFEMRLTRKNVVPIWNFPTLIFLSPIMLNSNMRKMQLVSHVSCSTE